MIKVEIEKVVRGYAVFLYSRTGERNYIGRRTTRSAAETLRLKTLAIVLKLETN